MLVRYRGKLLRNGSKLAGSRRCCCGFCCNCRSLPDTLYGRVRSPVAGQGCTGQCPDTDFTFTLVRVFDDPIVPFGERGWKFVGTGNDGPWCIYLLCRGIAPTTPCGGEFNPIIYWCASCKFNPSCSDNCNDSSVATPASWTPPGTVCGPWNLRFTSFLTVSCNGYPQGVTILFEVQDTPF